MAKEIFTAIKSIFPDHPIFGAMVGAVIAFVVFIITSYVRGKWDEIEGWLKRHDKQFDEIRENVSGGLKDERIFQYDAMVRHDKLLIDFGRELSEYKGVRMNDIIQDRLIKTLEEFSKSVRIYADSAFILTERIDQLTELLNSGKKNDTSNKI